MKNIQEKDTTNDFFKKNNYREVELKWIPNSCMICTYFDYKYENYNLNNNDYFLHCENENNKTHGTLKSPLMVCNCFERVKNKENMKIKANY